MVPLVAGAMVCLILLPHVPVEPDVADSTAEGTAGVDACVRASGGEVRAVGDEQSAVAGATAVHTPSASAARKRGTRVSGRVKSNMDKALP